MDLSPRLEKMELEEDCLENILDCCSNFPKYLIINVSNVTNSNTFITFQQVPIKGISMQINNNTSFSPIVKPFTLVTQQNLHKHLISATKVILLSNGLTTTIKNFNTAKVQLRLANENFVLIAQKYGKISFSKFRGHVYEALHAATFSINAAIQGSPLKAIQTSTIKGFGNHPTVDILVTSKNLTNTNSVNLALSQAPNCMKFQLKSGVTSAKRICNKKYLDVMCVSELSAKRSKQFMQVGNICSSKVTTNQLCNVTRAVVNGEKVVVMSKWRMFAGAARAGLKSYVLFSIGESGIRNGYYLYKGEITFKDAGKNVICDVLLINTAKDIYNWYTNKSVNNVDFTQRTTRDLSSNFFMPFENDFSYYQYQAKPLHYQYTESNSYLNSISIGDFDIYSTRSIYQNEYSKMLHDEIENIYTKKVIAANEKERVNQQKAYVSNIIQQGITTAVVTITDKLVRGQPPNWKETIQVSTSAIGVCTGAIIGGNYCSNIIGKVVELSTTNKIIAGTGTAAGIATTVIDIGITAYNKGGLTNLDSKDYLLAGGKGIITGASSIASEMILSKGLSLTGTTAAGGCIGAAVNTVFALWAMYETRTLKDYNMNKWTWKSVASSAVKGAVSTGACMAVVSVVAAANWWNPVGWTLGIATAVFTHAATTYIEEKCSDEWGQRKKHMDYCCQILGCTDKITQKEFAKIIRRNRAKFHPDKTTENNEKMCTIQECIDAYCILRKWDPEDLFTDKDTVTTSWSRKLFKKLFDAVNDKFRAISILNVLKTVKDNKCFVSHLIVYGPDDEIPENASIIPGGEDFDKTAIENKSKRIRVVYIKDEYKDYSLTSFSTILGENGTVSSISEINSSKDEPIRTVIILNHNPGNNNAIKVCCKIAPELWLIGLTDNSETILTSLAEECDDTLEDID
jgi:hypothetical protein